ncbi:RNA-guided endonuclease TnpB family protein [Companilactobacillus mishanensis]|uniref:IS200/IS605 family element transposase accessory protein TnpB n=1 Tax=Companilactobacillus mishanensis TaxID=2486008 RepID=A0ABW9P9A6_9LACO|nr:RNA-guided endonuclease TnpB family protein [Companilactobacillus mishanensis]MQS45836.1 IS200/IS605 family element transposase accessory protein TnpB [Companilactobacillus mishanensis]
MALKGIKLRIYPTEYQIDKLESNFGCVRKVWNLMLAMHKERYENNPDCEFVTRFDMNILLSLLKKEYPYLKEVESTSLQCVSKDLSEAFKKFFKEHTGYPKFKSRKYPRQSYRSICVNNNIKQIDDSHIKLPKLGEMKFKCGKSIPEVIKSVTIRKSPAGKYYAVLLVEGENQVFNKTQAKVGLDMGVADLIITSDSRKYKTIRFDKILAKKKRFWERKLARRRLLAIKDRAKTKKFGLVEPKDLNDYKNVGNARIMVAKYSEKISNQRKDYLHKITIQLVKDYDVITIEDLKTKDLLKNHKLSLAIANQSWRMVRQMLEYKCEWYRKKLIVVDPFKTSQFCSECGYDDGTHELKVRQWTCPNCNINNDRDINASKNILLKGLEQALVK